MLVSLWWLLPVCLLVVYSVVVTYFWLKGCPIPVVDKGHRAFAVETEKAAVTIARIIRATTGMEEQFTFDAEPTVQTLIGNDIVLMRHLVKTDAPNGLSLVVKDPSAAALLAVQQLHAAGFIATMTEGFIPSLGKKLVVVNSEAFLGWALVFRNHALKLGKPPNRRMITAD